VTPLDRGVRAPFLHEEAEGVMNNRLLRGAFVLLAVGIVSCSSNPPPEQPQPPPPASTPPPPPTPPPPTSTACDAGQVTQVQTQFAGRVGTEAPKMDPEGGLLCGNVPEGGTVVSQDFTMYPGYCYTILGASLPSVQTIKLLLAVDPAGAGFPPALAALVSAPLMVDNSPTAMTAANAGKDCYKYVLPLPGPVKLTVTAKQGQGPVAAQVYKRKLSPAETPPGLHF
jgi:hypothetical protein